MFTSILSLFTRTDVGAGPPHPPNNQIYSIAGKKWNTTDGSGGTHSTNKRQPAGGLTLGDRNADAEVHAPGGRRSGRIRSRGPIERRRCAAARGVGHVTAGDRALVEGGVDRLSLIHI